MALQHRSILVRHTQALRLAAAAALAAGLAAWAAPGAAQPVGTELRMTELERAFWACDHAATTGRVDDSTAVTCVALTDALKQRKFNGDFNALLAWWREHKEVEHVALAAAARNALARLAPMAPR